MEYISHKHTNIELIIANLTALVEQIDPDVGYSDWIRVLMVIYNETGGAEEGFRLADSWSGRGNKYKGTKDIRSKWRCFKPNHPKPLWIGTLIRMTRG